MQNSKGRIETIHGVSKMFREILGIIGVLLVMYLISNYSNTVLPKVFDLEKPNAPIFFYNRLLLWGGLLLFFLYVKFYLKEKFLPWKEEKLSILHTIISVILLLVVLLVGFVGLVLFIQSLDIPTQGERLEGKGILYQNIPLMIFFAFTAAVLEELLFRGYILPTITKLTNSMWLGIGISSVLFGLMHLSYGTLHQVVIPIYFAIIFSTYYAKYRNLKIIMFCHFVWNLVVYFDSAELL